MTPGISLVRLGDGVDPAILAPLPAALTSILHIPCSIESEILDISPAFDADRRQYRVDRILQLLCDGIHHRGGVRRLGVAAHDLFLPVLTHVFGAGQLAGSCAVVSLYRLREEIYGLAESWPLLEERLLKESLHELGHTSGLRHCDAWQCVMSSSNSVELVDLKSARYCVRCQTSLQRTLHGHGSLRSSDPAS